MRGSTPTRGRKVEKDAVQTSAGPPSVRTATPGRDVGRSVRRTLSPMRGRSKVAAPTTPGKAKPATPAADAAAAASGLSSPVDGDSAAAAADAAEPCRITVAVRIKPTDGAKTIMRFGPRQENALRFTHVDGAKSGDEAKSFAYDHVFDQSESQADVYKALGDSVTNQVLRGQNASVFAYGQTGSGKTYTMLGTEEERGLIPRLCEGIFKHECLQTWNVTVSFFEIYNEQVVDLLNPPAEAEEGAAGAPAGGKTPDGKRGAQDDWHGVGLDPKRKIPVLNALRVREHAKHGVYVEGLTKQVVKAPADVERALEQGASLRAVAETAMNAESSRSHAVVQLSFAEVSSCRWNPMACPERATPRWRCASREPPSAPPCVAHHRRSPRAPPLFSGRARPEIACPRST